MTQFVNSYVSDHAAHLALGRMPLAPAAAPVMAGGKSAKKQQKRQSKKKEQRQSKKKEQRKSKKQNSRK